METPTTPGLLKAPDLVRGMLMLALKVCDTGHVSVLEFVQAT